MSVSQDTTVRADSEGCGDKRRLKKTKTPGVYRRVDANGKTIGYVAVIEVAGKQRKRSARTYSAACRIKRESETDRDRGELQEPTTTGFVAFLDEWVERYRGQGRRGFRENTRDEYRRLIDNYARPYFSSKLKLIDVTTYQLARFVDWLADEDEQGKCLSDSTIANIAIPLRAALTTANREGLIRHNPSQGLTLPHREDIEEDKDEDEIKVFSREQLAAVLAMAPESYKLLFEVLATSGLRISEGIALQRLHFQIDGSTPEVCVRRAIVRGRVEPPKTKYGRREVALPAPLVYRLRAHFAAQEDQDSTALAFTNRDGNVLEYGNLLRRHLKPIVEEVNAPWAGFHTFRHTFASIHLSQGTNLLQLSRALGHYSAAFTLSRYTHLLPGDEAPALDLTSTIVAPSTELDRPSVPRESLGDACSQTP
ncbi:MAG TPA: tyrosine-type recombinase/integrase [Solirubrobacterales bacterium]|nr:tyrosine-type recombinase/integrase [Solirubrobacterales bacterium]